jgi:Protein of unknown function (DUF4233)
MSKRSVASAVLVLEAVVIVLAIPVAIAIANVDATVAVWAGGAVALFCIVVVALLRYPVAYTLGWVVQALAIAMGFVVPTMFILGGIFALLWFLTFRLARTIEMRHRAGEVPPS